MTISKKPDSTNKSQNTLLRNTTIDSLRIVLAVLIVYIHLNGRLYNRVGLDGLSLVFDDIIMILARTAVPIFLAISGYCLYRNSLKAEQQSIRRSLHRLALLAMGCFAIYIITSIIVEGPLVAAANFTSSRFLQLILFNQTGGLFDAGAPWFILALIVCYLIYYFYPYLTKSQKYLVIASALLYFWAICISPAYGNIILDKESAMLFRNYLGLGLPFFSLGYFFHKYQDRIKTAISNQTVKFAILGFVLYAIEQVIYLSGGHRRYPMEISIMMPLVVVGVLMLATQHSRLLAKTKFPAWSAKYSLYLYIGHTAVLNILSKYLFDNEPPASLRYYKVLLLYVSVIAATLILAMLYVKFKHALQMVARRIRGSNNLAPGLKGSSVN